MSEYGFCKRCGETVEVGVLPQDRAQARVFQAVKERGYTKGWSCDQFLGRQLAKMAEELGEACAAGLGLLPVETQERIQLAEAPGSRDVVRAALEKAEKDTVRGVR